MHILMWFIAAICGYLIGGLNLAITLSRLIYHQDIRKAGSGNPGFTNFKRLYGNRYAWFVFVFDLCKAAVLCVIFGLIFKGLDLGWQRGVAFTGLFVMLGHSFPVYYRFEGGKGFLVLLSMLWLLDWRAGAIGTAVMVILLLTLRYMSLATMSALTAGAVCLFLFGADTLSAVINACCVLFMIWRHRENIRRLLAGTESRFSFRSKKR